MGPTVHSLGYSDDTAVVSDSWDGAALQHDWVREFFVSHHLRLNPSKSYCVIGSGICKPLGDLAPRWLPGIDEAQVHDPLHGATCTVVGRPTKFGENDIKTHGPSKAFRYLGYQVRLDLECGEVIKSMALKIRESCSMIRSHR